MVAVYLDWPVQDPAGRAADAVRPIRDDLAHRVQALLADLLPTTGEMSDRATG